MLKKTQSLSRNFILAILLCTVVSGFFWISQSVATVQLPRADAPAEFYSNNNHNDLKQTYLTALNSAQKSILLIVYSLTDPDVIATLNKKANEGLDVRVICDRKASAQVSRKLNKNVSLLKRSSVGLMHQKIVVIDEKENWIGSANMTSESLRMHDNLVVAMHHPEMAQFIIEKSELFPPQGRAPPFKRKDFLLKDQRVELWFLPDNPDALDRLVEIIGNAKKSLRIAQFTWTHPDLTSAVIAAKMRGVDVEVVIDLNAGRGSSAETVSRLKDSGIKVGLGRGNVLLHHKFMCCDGSILVNGSANWTRAAFKNNDDCFIVLHSMTELQRISIENIWKYLWLDSVN